MDATGVDQLVRLVDQVWLFLESATLLLHSLQQALPTVFQRQCPGLIYIRSHKAAVPLHCNQQQVLQ